MEVGGLEASYLNMDDYRLSSSSKVQNTNFGSFLERASAILRSEGTMDGGAPGSKTKIDKNDELYQACLELETFLVKNLLTSMRNTVQKSGLINEGFAGKMYEDMLYDEYAKDFTKNANFGLAEQAYLQLEKAFRANKA